MITSQDTEISLMDLILLRQELPADYKTVEQVTAAAFKNAPHASGSEALRALSSTINKCEKVMPKLKPGTAQHSLLTSRIKAVQIANILIMRELDSSITPKASPDS